MMKNKSFVIQKSDSWKMFDRIAPRYDFLNHLLSFGQDIIWRQRLVNFLPQGSDLSVLDLATGTGDVLIQIVRRCPRIIQAEGIDLADKMLNLGRKKIHKAGMDGKIRLARGDANHIHFDSGSFDSVTMAFGIRNVDNPITVLKEIARVLKSGGRVLILEFSLPRFAVLRILHIFYLRSVVPFLGWLFSGHFQAYFYLNRTIERFPYGEQFCRMLEQVGLQNVNAHPLMGGIATIYVGEKH